MQSSRFIAKILFFKKFKLYIYDLLFCNWYKIRIKRFIFFIFPGGLTVVSSSLINNSSFKFATELQFLSYNTFFCSCGGFYF